MLTPNGRRQRADLARKSIFKDNKIKMGSERDEPCLDCMGRYINNGNLGDGHCHDRILQSGDTSVSRCFECGTHACSAASSELLVKFSELMLKTMTDAGCEV